MSDVNIKNLRHGINLWRQNRFDNDFHNSTYTGLLSARSDGFSVRYWEYLVDLLASWRAIRPLTKVEIRARGLERLANIEKEYWRIFKAFGNSEPDLSTAKWYELQNLFSMASSIKGVFSPVFPSKLCHFIMPNTFPVIDRKFIGLNYSYESYWKYCQDAWIACNEKEELKQFLLAEIGEPVVLSYPWSTKITEICFAALQKALG